MSLDNTVTEQQLDAGSRHLYQSKRKDSIEFEPDLAVDGLSESIISRFIRLITIRSS